MIGMNEFKLNIKWESLEVVYAAVLFAGSF
jgi:hypothetical protein